MRFKYVFIFAMALISTQSLSSKPQLNFTPATSIQEISSRKNVTFSHARKNCQAVVFYASWCVGCSELMRNFKSQLGDSPSKPMCVISVDNTRSEALSYFDTKKDLQYLRKTSFLDSEGQMASEVNIPGLPFGMILDPKTGKMQKAYFGKKLLK